MAIEGSVSWGVHAHRGRSVWAVLCRAALRAVDVAAAAFGVKDVEVPVERTELLVAYGLAPQLPVPSWQSLDWAKLSELDRAHLARQMLAGDTLGTSGGEARYRR